MAQCKRLSLFDYCASAVKKKRTESGQSTATGKAKTKIQN